jgi:hypothetical protein
MIFSVKIDDLSGKKQVLVEIIMTTTKIHFFKCNNFYVYIEIFLELFNLGIYQTKAHVFKDLQP